MLSTAESIFADIISFPLYGWGLDVNLTLALTWCQCCSRTRPEPRSLARTLLPHFSVTFRSQQGQSAWRPSESKTLFSKGWQTKLFSKQKHFQSVLRVAHPVAQKNQWGPQAEHGQVIVQSQGCFRSSLVLPQPWLPCTGPVRSAQFASHNLPCLAAAAGPNRRTRVDLGAKKRAETCLSS